MLRRFLALLLPWLTLVAQELPLASSSAWGSSASGEEVRGTAILADGTLLVALNADPATAVLASAVTLTGASATDRGVVVHLAADGRSVLGAVRVAAQVHDLALDGDDLPYVATDTGVVALTGTLALRWRALSTERVYRVDADGQGSAVRIAGLLPLSWIDPDSKPGNSTIVILEGAGTELSRFSGQDDAKYQVTDVALDTASGTVAIIGWWQASTYAPDLAQDGVPVQISFLRGRDLTGAARWRAYDWSAVRFLDLDGDGTATDPNPRWINAQTNNMADTRGLRVARGRDGGLYAVFNSAGGNHIFRASTTDLATSQAIVGGDVFADFAGAGSEHLTVFGVFDWTGAVRRVQQFASHTSRLSPNTAWCEGGGIAADEDGRVYLAGKSAWGLPMSPNALFSPEPGVEAFNPFPPDEYLGGGFLVAYTPGLRRSYCTRVAPRGESRAVAARRLAGETAPRVAWGGRADAAGPLYLRGSPQAGFGGGDSDGFLVIHGPQAVDPPGAGETPLAISATTDSSAWGAASVRDGVAATVSGPDAAGVVQQGWPWSTTTRFLTEVTGPKPVYGGLMSFLSNPVAGATSSIGSDATNLLSVRHQPPTGSSYQHRHAFGLLVRTADLAPGRPGPWRLGRGTPLGATFNANVEGEIRWLVEQGGRLYASRTPAYQPPTGPTFQPETGLNLTADDDDGEWGEVLGGDPLTTDLTALSWSRWDFNAITAVGLVVTSRTTTGRYFIKLVALRTNLTEGVANQAPVAAATITPAVVRIGEAITADATASSDAEGPLAFHSWNLGDGTTLAGPVIQHAYDVAGPWPVGLTVYDAGYAKATSTRRAEVVEAGSADPARVLGVAAGAMSASWGSTLTTADVDGDGQTDDEIAQRAIDTAVAQVPGTDLLTAWRIEIPNVTTQSVTLSAATDLLGLRINQTCTVVQVLVAIPKEQFLNGAAFAPATWGAGDGLDAGSLLRQDQVAASALRYVVRDGSQWWVSEQTVASGPLVAPGSGDHGRWAAFAPATSLAIPASGYATRVFGDLTAGGVLLDARNTTARLWWEWSRLRLTGTLTGAPAAAPVARWTGTLPATLPGTITLDASTSTSGVAITAWRWRLSDGRQFSGTPVTVAVTDTTGLTATLTIEDAAGRTATLTQAIPAASSGSGSGGAGSTGGSASPAANGGGCGMGAGLALVALLLRGRLSRRAA